MLSELDQLLTQIKNSNTLALAQMQEVMNVISKAVDRLDDIRRELLNGTENPEGLADDVKEVIDLLEDI
jgi:hypothetical protein